jgi:hypothetical protein
MAQVSGRAFPASGETLITEGGLETNLISRHGHA